MLKMKQRACRRQESKKRQRMGHAGLSTPNAERERVECQHHEKAADRMRVASRVAMRQ